MQVAYVAGKYRGATHREVVENIREAERVAVALWKLGYAVLCPHMNTAFFSGICDEQVFLDGTMAMLRRCDLVVVTDNWLNSTGARAEVAEALRLEMPVLMLDDGELRTFPVEYALRCAS